MFTNLFHFRLIYHELGYVKILSLYAANIVRHLNSNNPKPAMKGDLDLVVMEINSWSTNLPSLSSFSMALIRYNNTILKFLGISVLATN